MKLLANTRTGCQAARIYWYFGTMMDTEEEVKQTVVDRRGVHPFSFGAAGRCQHCEQYSFQKYWPTDQYLWVTKKSSLTLEGRSGVNGLASRSTGPTERGQLWL